MDIKYLYIAIIILTFSLNVYLNTRIIERKKRIAIYFVSFIIICLNILFFTIERNEDLKREKIIQQTFQLEQRNELFNMDFPQSYIDSLQKDPLLKHYYNEGQRYEKEYNFLEAILEYEKCLGHANATSIDKTSMHFLVGNCYYFLGKLKEAENEYNESLKTLKTIKDKTERVKGKSYIQINMGNIYFQLNQPMRALEYCKRALKDCKEIGFKQGQAFVFNNIGNIYIQLGQMDKALSNHREALEINKEIGYQHGEAISQGNIGMIYSFLGQPEEALKHYMDALEIYKKIDYKINYPQDIANNLFNIGSAYLSLGKLKEALVYFRDALKIYEEIGYKEGKAVALSSIGDVYQCLEQPQEALFYYEKALKIYKILDNQSQIEKVSSFIKDIEEKINIK